MAFPFTALEILPYSKEDEKGSKFVDLRNHPHNMRISNGAREQT
jgi:hypothetical protein